VREAARGGDATQRPDGRAVRGGDDGRVFQHPGIERIGHDCTPELYSFRESVGVQQKSRIGSLARLLGAGLEFAAQQQGQHGRGEDDDAGRRERARGS
jgi:hypothetical protein